jgi:hypothetical protein
VGEPRVDLRHGSLLLPSLAPASSSFAVSASGGVRDRDPAYELGGKGSRNKGHQSRQSSQHGQPNACPRLQPIQVQFALSLHDRLETTGG